VFIHSINGVLIEKIPFEFPLATIVAQLLICTVFPVSAMPTIFIVVQFLICDNVVIVGVD
jgi:hypothetical protein